MKNSTKLFMSGMLLLSISGNISAQRIQQQLGRGVVAINNGNKVAVTWRKLAQEPENISYNIYVSSTGSTNYSKINSTPITNTNFVTTSSAIPINSDVCVTTVINGVESAKSDPFSLKSQFMRNVFVDINYTDVLDNSLYKTKYVWPADLTGDGEYDYIVDRLSNGTDSHKIEAYTRHGEHLWTVDLGPNVKISQGHDDMVIAYDMDCDGKAEVVIKSSDGTRFWNKSTNTFGDYLFGSATGDTDNDGITDYSQQSKRNPPQYITVIDGLTGTEKNTIEMTYPSYSGNTYTRDNKSEYMDEEYSKLNGHMGIAYFDGIHPSVVMEYMVRTKDKNHHYYVSAWGYDFENGKATNWKEKFQTWSRNDKTPWPAEFHHIRVADVSLDGRDEMLDGGFAVKYDGTMLFSAGISHGDRFRVGDIDPDRPGLETFAIQQNAGDMLGQILYDAATGKEIKKWYMASVGDVGRGECMDVDPDHKGYEMWSTMGNLYNAKGELIKAAEVNNGLPFPTEGIWWDGEPDREMLTSADGNGYNADIRKFGGTRLIEMAKESGYTVSSEYGKRPMYFGDIIGDWREEVILRKGTTSATTGIVGYTTDLATTINLYCLQQNPAYRMQCTTKGYYQSAFPDYYLGYDMPMPPLPPSMVSDLVWGNDTEWNSSSASFTDFARTSSMCFQDGKSVIFDLAGNTKVNISNTLKPSVVYAMPPKGIDYVWSGNGTLAGNMDLWKSMNGTLTINNKLEYTGKTYISEGTLILNTTLPGDIELKAKGTLAGEGVINGNVTFEGALNYEGCRLSPGCNDNRFGKITFGKSLSLPGEVYIEMDLQTHGEIKHDQIKVNGNMSLANNNYLTIVCNETKPEAGEYPLISWTGALSGSVENISVRGIAGISYKLKTEDKSLILVINSQRTAAQNVFWMGNISNIWDFVDENFTINGDVTSFVTGDQVILDDSAESTDISMSDMMELSEVKFLNQNASYTISGNGGLTRATSLIKDGSGDLNLYTKKSDYTGMTKLKGGIVTITEIADAGIASSIGSASAIASNIQLEDVTMKIDNINAATNRGMTINGDVEFNVPEAKGYTTLKGIITGYGKLIKNGAGQLNITYSGNNTYTGGTVVKEGTLAMGTYNTTFGKSGSTLTVENGAVNIFDNNNTSQVPDFNYELVIPDKSTAYLNAGSRCYINGSVKGAGTLCINFPYVRGDVKADFSGFTGTLKATGSDFRLSKAMDFSQATVDLINNVTMGHYSTGSSGALTATTKIGALTSTGSPTILNGTYNIGYNNKNTTFSGIFSSVTVNKYGTGTLTLTGASTSAINIYEGRINANAELTTSTTITVSNEGTLGGTGKVRNVTVNNGGTISVGLYQNSVSKFGITNTLIVNEGGSIYWKSSTRGIDSLHVANLTRLTDATIKLNLGGTHSIGDELQIINCPKITGTYSVDPTTPGEGLEWDHSKFLSEGKLIIKAATGLRTIGRNSVKVNNTFQKSWDGATKGW